MTSLAIPKRGRQPLTRAEQAARRTRMREFSDLIYELSFYGYTQLKIASVFNVSRQYISQMHRTRSPSDRVLRGLKVLLATEISNAESILRNEANGLADNRKRLESEIECTA